MMKIAIIDSGIEVSHKRLKNCKISGVAINEVNNKFIISNEFEDKLGHGTGIAGIIHSIVPDAELVAVKIFHNELKTTEKMVCFAIDWCLKNGIEIVNLSLGLPSKCPSLELHELCVSCYSKNVIIIAAAYHTGIECYPAYFPEVIGVTAGNAKNKFDFGYLPNSPVEFIAKGNAQRIANINNGFKIVDGTSFACANFTGIVGKILLEEKVVQTFQIIKEYLINNANTDIEPIYKTSNYRKSHLIQRSDIDAICEKWIDREKKLSWLDKIAIFPASEKEMSAFIKLPHLSTSSNILFFDYPKTFDDVNSIDGDINIIKRLPSTDDLEQFDSLVIGYFFEHLFPSNVNFGRSLVSKSVLSNKNMFLFDKNIYNYFINREKENKKINIYCPVVTKEIADDINAFQYHDNIKTPLLSVIGTSNRQGKFTAQLRIKEILSKSGYKIAHLSTEPQGELFGADFSFPIGHNTTVDLPFVEWSTFLRSLTKAMEYYLKPDIILTGTQGSISPLTYAYPEGNIFNNMQFLFGVQPDALVCAINPNDSIETIFKNIDAVKSISNSKLLFATITPWMRNFKRIDNQESVADFTFLNKSEINERIKYYEYELKVPVFDIMDNSNEQLILETITNFYS
jgi:uncharacterized NAD-dependent epimerase/dehydratase family protein